MRADQKTKLDALSEGLADVLIDEADPANWPGAGTKLAELSRVDRGDRYWCKKNAFATVALLARVEQLRSAQHGGSTPVTGDGAVVDPLDKEIAEAEAIGRELLAKLGGKAEFDKRVHGAS